MKLTDMKRLKMAALLLLGGSLFANSACLTRQFAAGLAQNTVSQVANILIDAALIDPLAEAVSPDDEVK